MLTSVHHMAAEAAVLRMKEFIAMKKRMASSWGSDSSMLNYSQKSKVSRRFGLMPVESINGIEAAP